MHTYKHTYRNTANTNTDYEINLICTGAG